MTPPNDSREVICEPYDSLEVISRHGDSCPSAPNDSREVISIPNDSREVISGDRSVSVEVPNNSRGVIYGPNDSREAIYGPNDSREVISVSRNKEDILTNQVGSNTPPHRGVGRGGEREPSKMWRRLMSLREDADYLLFQVADFETSTGGMWCETWADWLVEQVRPLENKPGIGHVGAVVAKRLAEMHRLGRDFQEPAPGFGHRKASVARVIDGSFRPIDEAGGQEPDGRPLDSDGRAAALWSETLRDLTERVTPPTFAAWLEHTVGLSLLADRLVVGVPSVSHVDEIEHRLYATIQDSVERQAGRALECEFRVIDRESYLVDVVRSRNDGDEP